MLTATLDACPVQYAHTLWGTLSSSSLEIAFIDLTKPVPELRPLRFAGFRMRTLTATAAVFVSNTDPQLLLLYSLHHTHAVTTRVPGRGDTVGFAASADAFYFVCEAFPHGQCVFCVVPLPGGQSRTPLPEVPLTPPFVAPRCWSVDVSCGSPGALTALGSAHASLPPLVVPAAALGSRAASLTRNPSTYVKGTTSDCVYELGCLL